MKRRVGSNWPLPQEKLPSKSPALLRLPQICYGHVPVFRSNFLLSLLLQKENTLLYFSIIFFIIALILFDLFIYVFIYVYFYSMYLFLNLFIMWSLYVKKLMSVSCNSFYFSLFLPWLFPLKPRYPVWCGDGGSIYVCVGEGVRAAFVCVIGGWC